MHPRARILPGAVLGVLALAAVAAPCASAGGVGSQAGLDLDHLLRRSEEAQRARWLFRPSDPIRARGLLGRAGIEEVARLARFDDLWVLEAPLDSVARVEQEWSSLGELRRDQSGRAALLESTALVGAGSPLWDGLDLRGDPTNSVAILDSGCDTAHQDLGDFDDDNQDFPPAGGDADDWVDATPAGFSPDYLHRVVGWHDVTDDLPLAVGPYDYHYHGTAAASAAFGSGRLDEARRGVAPDGRFVVVKTWNFEGRWERWASDFLLGVDWVLTHRDTHRIRACLVTTVWDEDLGLSQAVQALVDAGIAVVAAAGNDGATEMGYPARVDDVIAVGATDSEGRVASYSTPSPLGERRLDLVAPGGSLVNPNDQIVVADNEPNDSYRGRVGTSLAAAHVAGALSILSQAMVESGRPFERSPSQVRRLQSLLRVTAAETAGAESGAVGSPRLDRLGPDEVEGWGLLQIPAALGALRRVVWPGEGNQLELGAPIDGPASWGARIAVHGLEPLRVELLPPEGADFDLLVYREEEDGLQFVARSTRSGVGAAESAVVRQPRPGWYVMVVKRVLGSGQARLEVHRSETGAGAWPLPLLSVQTSPPTRYDLDEDGREELLVVNNLSNDDTGHRFYAVHADGSPVLGFPRVYFSDDDRGGELTAGAVGRLGSSPAYVVGSENGEVFAVGAGGQLRFRTLVSGRDPTTTPVLLDEGIAARVAVGTPDGVVLLDPAGAVDDTLALEGGARGAPAAGDLDGDGQDEVVVFDAGRRLHVFQPGGGERPGWPFDASAEVEVTPPILLGAGDGSPPHSIVFLARDASGTARLHRLDRDGSEYAGFPVSVLESGLRAQRLSPLCVSPLERGGAPHIVGTMAALDPADRFSLELRGVSLDGSVTSASSLPLAASAFDGTFLILGQIGLSEPVPVQWTSRGGYEFAQAFRGVWSEFVVGRPSRYGSTRRITLWSPDAPAPRQLHRGEGRERVLEDPLGVPLVADLDSDGQPELYVGYRESIARWISPVPFDPSETWGHERGGAARRGCYGCEARVVVDAPSAVSTSSRLLAAPNPFNPRTVLHVVRPAGRDLRWELFDARGRSLRRWTSLASGDGDHEEIFQAVDAAGRRLSSGVYFLRVRSGGQELRTRLTLLR